MQVYARASVPSCLYSSTMIITLGTTPTVQRTMVFDRVTLDQVNRAKHVHDHASGKAINAARVIRVLGDDVLALGFQGGDTGAFCSRDLDSLGIPHAFIDVSSPTRTCTTIVDLATRQTTELVEETAPVEAAHTDAIFSLLKQHIASARVLVLSGTLAPGVPDDFYARCVSLARQHAVATIVDAKGEALKLAIAEHPTWIKPNKDEVEVTVGHPIKTEQDLLVAIKELAAAGANHIVVTRGADHVLFYDGSQTKLLTIPQVEAINPIGSGDAVAGGIAFGWANRKSSSECVNIGIACGVANAMTPYSGHVTLEGVAEVMARLGGD